MERKSSIHIEKGNLGYCFHNTRQKSTANSIFLTEKNEFDNDALKAVETYRNELKKRELAYTKRTGKKLNKNTITHLSAIVNLNKRHTLEDVKKVAKYLEQTLGTKVFQIAVHRDEGYIDKETGEKKINYHAHLEMLGLDEEGNSVRRKLTRSYLINLQNEVAKILNMQRGINYTKERKKRPKRLDTYEYKEYAKRKARELKPILRENKELKLSKKQLEKQISELRKKMIEANKDKEEKIFTQEDYKYLSELKRLTKSRSVREIYLKFLKFKELANSKIREANEKIRKEQEEKKELKRENEELKKKNIELLEKIKELHKEIQNFIKEIKYYKKIIQEITQKIKEQKHFNFGTFTKKNSLKFKP